MSIDRKPQKGSSKKGKRQRRKKPEKKTPRGYKRTVKRNMHNYGDIDFDKKEIRVNPRHGDLLNTILHEEAHRRYPEKSEKKIKKIAKKQETALTLAKAAKLLKKYMRHSDKDGKEVK